MVWKDPFGGSTPPSDVTVHSEMLNLRGMNRKRMQSCPLQFFEFGVFGQQRVLPRASGDMWRLSVIDIPAMLYQARINC